MSRRGTKARFTKSTVFATPNISVKSTISGKKETIHRPAPVQNFSLQKEEGAHRGKISVVDMVFLVFIGFLYPPPAWKVFFEARKVLLKIFFRWWLCALFSSLNSSARGPPQFLKKRSENSGANENLSNGFAAIPGIAPRVAPRIVVFTLLKS